jgi:predicted TIM-barrel fold metal-dependent hydrolase
MILDGHIHIEVAGHDRSAFLARLKQAGVDGGVVISLPPPGLLADATSLSAAQRLDDLLSLTQESSNLFPLFWIDPTLEDARKQVDAAVHRGVAGFKVICHNHEPGDARAMRTFGHIASCGKPILFHSGILWNGADSSRHNRPLLFEALLEVQGLRFTLAHIGWPWCDELIAVYGKFLNARTHRPGRPVEMYIDLTPGTPPIYRRDALVKLFTVGYPVEHNVIFGSDCNVHDYNQRWSREWLVRDNAIYDELGLAEAARQRIYGENLLRWLGMSADPVEYEPLRPALSQSHSSHFLAGNNVVSERKTI